MCVAEDTSDGSDTVPEYRTVSLRAGKGLVRMLFVLLPLVLQAVPAAQSQQESDALAEARRLADSSYWRDRGKSVGILRGISGAEAVPLLARLAADSAVRVRRGAVFDLVVRGKRSVPVLVELAENDDWRVRANALGGLAALGDVAGASAARKGLKDPNANVRRAAVVALGACVGDEAIAEIVAAARVDGTLVKSAAAETISKIGTSNALAALGEMLESNNFFVRDQVSMALSRAGEEAVPHIVKALSSPMRDARCLAARSLGLIGGHEAAVALQGALRDESPSVRRMVLWALGRDLDERSSMHVLRKFEVTAPRSEARLAHEAAQRIFEHVVESGEATLGDTY